MRITLDIDEDLVLAVKKLAHERNQSIGHVVSELLREALTQGGTAGSRNGVPLFPLRPDAGIVTPELVNRLNGYG
jgi:hypothetical protein